MILFMIAMIESPRDRDIVERIYQRFYRAIYQCAYNTLQNKQDAEDAVMNTFKRIIEHAHKFDLESDDDIAALVSIYAKNEINRLYRARNRYLEHYVNADEYPQLTPIADSGEDIVQEVIQKETLNEVMSVLDQLDSAERDLFLLKHYYSYSYAEIAEILGISENNAQVKVHRLKKKILKKIGGTKT
ncbi:MAG: sigma-70 family RNA polymerase sigma factor [Ruminococcaceae bacterium]|nr:sigma-70 family RNA polymerase sigma factor [Oscillospiraceae bacterium]